MSFLSITVSIFLIMNSIGHINAYLELVESLNVSRRRWIITREMCFALIIMVIFNYLGEFLLAGLDVDHKTVFLSGGLILFLSAIRMIFPQSKMPLPPSEKTEPFIFPIATPMIAGPSVLTAIMLYAYQENMNHLVLLAIFIAWVFSISILFFAEQIGRLIGKRTLTAVERLMGLLLTMMAVEMLLSGIRLTISEGL